MAAVRYFAINVHAAAAFYADRLGFTVSRDWGPVVILERDGLELWVSGPGSSAAKESPGGIQTGGTNRLVVSVDGLDAFLRALREAGVPAREIVDGAAGRWVVVEDPAGNPVELFEPRA